jgi:hypothetical protein
MDGAKRKHAVLFAILGGVVWLWNKVANLWRKKR